MKELKDYVSKDAVKLLGFRNNRWSLGLYEHRTKSMIVYCVARIASFMSSPEYEFYLNPDKALSRFNDILNVIRVDND